jgi:hypothetical protein
MMYILKNTHLQNDTCKHILANTLTPSSGKYRFCGGIQLMQFFGGLLYEKEYEIMNMELGIKENIYIGSLPGPWKCPMQVRCPKM